jgi:hypothetical protein
VESKASENKWE